MEKAFELNKALFEAVAACNYEETKRLLNMGADSLGSTDKTDADEHLLGELFCEIQDTEALEAAFPKFLELFYAHGMDIASRGLPTNDGNDLHPLWMLAFCQTESGLKILHTMLGHGLDRDSAEVLVDHILMDMEMCDGCEIEDAWWMESCFCGLKMLMLIASYPTILNESTYLQNCVALEKNDAQMLPQFRNWNDFDYHIDLSTCTNTPHGLRDATLTIRDPKSKKTVWTLSI